MERLFRMLTGAGVAAAVAVAAADPGVRQSVGLPPGTDASTDARKARGMLVLVIEGSPLTEGMVCTVIEVGE